MARARTSRMVDSAMLAEARKHHAGAADSSVVEQTLRALVARHRASEVDVDCATAYDAHPLEQADEWGDLASFRRAADAS